VVEIKTKRKNVGKCDHFNTLMIALVSGYSSVNEAT
jgi:hypothetical protein